MTVKQGLYARAVAFALAGALIVTVFEALGLSVVTAILGPDGDVAGIWTGVRMAGYSIAFVFAMLAIGRVGAALTYQEPDAPATDPPEPEQPSPAD